MARISKADWQLVREALNHAIAERESLRESLAGSTDLVDQQTGWRCENFIERAEAFSLKHFGKPSDFKLSNDRFSAMPTVSIFELGFRSK